MLLAVVFSVVGLVLVSAVELLASVFATSFPVSAAVGAEFESSVVGDSCPIIALFNPHDVKDKHKAMVQL